MMRGRDAPPFGVRKQPSVDANAISARCMLRSLPLGPVRQVLRVSAKVAGPLDGQQIFHIVKTGRFALGQFAERIE